MQKTLYREHGTTLNGLIKLYGMDPEPYLDFVHQIDLSDLSEIGAWLSPSRGCRAAAISSPMAAPGMPRASWTRLGMTHLFDSIWDIRSIGFVPKPDPAAYGRIVAHGGFAPGEAAMFDDIARNLVEAHALGMTTVWLNSHAHWDRQGPEFPVASALHIDHEINDLARFLGIIRI